MAAQTLLLAAETVCRLNVRRLEPKTPPRTKLPPLRRKRGRGNAVIPTGFRNVIPAKAGTASKNKPQAV